MSVVDSGKRQNIRKEGKPRTITAGDELENLKQAVLNVFCKQQDRDLQVIS